MSSTKETCASRVGLAAVLAVLCLGLGACASSPSASRSSTLDDNRTVTYKQLHSLMVRLAEEPAGGPVGDNVAVASLAQPQASGSLATNP
jgi:hypothetical protein